MDPNHKQQTRDAKGWYLPCNVITLTPLNGRIVERNAV